MPDAVWIGDAFARGPTECAPEYASLWEGLVGCWVPQMGSTGDTLLDLSGYGNHCTLTNMDPATDWVTWRDGWALDFDAYDDMAVTSAVMCATYPFTASAYVYLANASAKGTFVKIGKYGAVVGQGSGWGIGVGTTNWDTAGNNLVLLLEGVAWVPTGVAIGVGWHMVSMSIAANGVWRAVVDGVLKASNSTASTPIAPTTGTALGASIYNDELTQIRRGFQSRIAGAWLHERVLSVPECAAMAMDRLGLLRPRRRWWAVAPSGSAIAAISQYYRRLRSA